MQNAWDRETDEWSMLMSLFMMCLSIINRKISLTSMMSWFRRTLYSDRKIFCSSNAFWIKTELKYRTLADKFICCDANATRHELLNDRHRHVTTNSINMGLIQVSVNMKMTSNALNATYHLPQYYYVINYYEFVFISTKHLLMFLLLLIKWNGTRCNGSLHLMHLLNISFFGLVCVHTFVTCFIFIRSLFFVRFF